LLVGRSVGVRGGGREFIPAPSLWISSNIRARGERSAERAGPVGH